MGQTMPYSRFSWYDGVVRERGDAEYTAANKRKKPAAAVHQPHDKGYRSLLSSKKVFLELLRGFVKQDWVERIDEADLIKLDASYVSADFRGQSSDLVYRAKLRPVPRAARGRREASAAPREVWFYVLLEMQSTIDPLILFRLLCYMLELWRDVVKNAGDEAYKRDFVLPVIIPIVLYNGKRPWKAPLRFRDKLDGAEQWGAVEQSRPEEAETMITNIEKVMKRAWRQERREGKREGKQEGKLEVAQKLLASGMPLSEVARMVELPEDAIKTVAE